MMERENNEACLNAFLTTTPYFSLQKLKSCHGQFCERHQPFQRGDDGLGVLELATVEGDESTDFAWRRAIRGGIYLSSARIAHPTVG